MDIVKKKIACHLTDPFPTAQLATLDLGNMDGHRDLLLAKGFIATRSIKQFLNDKHSVIIGSFGSGKSALFNLLKDQSEHLTTYKEDLIVSIDEQIEFDSLKSDSKNYFPELSEKLTYQLLWKFQVCRRVTEEVAKLDGFPRDSGERYLSGFLDRTGGVGGDKSILTRIKNLFEQVSFKIKATLSDMPIGVELGKEAAQAIGRIELNLDKVIDELVVSIESREIRRCIVIIDKLDKFVSGEAYNTQRLYLESLLQLEDDLYSVERIGFKIFLRLDLYERLDFSSLGPDKAEDNTLRLIWSKNEIRMFIARRLLIALEEAGVWTLRSVFDSSDWSDESLKWHEKVLMETQGGVMHGVAKLIRKFIKRKRTETTLMEKSDIKILNKLFETKLVHECERGRQVEINSLEFFDTHFLDGHKSCTPRYMLVFLKELIDEANNYYYNSPNRTVTPVMEDGDWVYNLFTQELVYSSYQKAKEKYIRHVSKVDGVWTSYLLELLSKKKGKKSFDYKWIVKNISFPKIDEGKAVEFLVFLQVIGFLEPIEYSRDIKKRRYELPILYKNGVGKANC